MTKLCRSPNPQRACACVAGICHLPNQTRAKSGGIDWATARVGSANRQCPDSETGKSLRRAAGAAQARRKPDARSSPVMMAARAKPAQLTIDRSAAIC
jgi:hypothetical protein